MDRSPESFDKIERFIANKMSKEDIEAFMKEMAMYPELEIEVERHRMLREVLRNKKALEFKRNLQSITQEFYEEEKITEQEKNVFKQKSYGYLKIAAISVLFLGLSISAWNYFLTSNKKQDVYSQYYMVFPVSGDIRTENKSGWSVLIGQYSNMNYVGVIKVFEAQNNPKLSDELKLYIGNSYLNTNKPKKAIEVFELISDQSGFYEDALWYRSLTNIKMNKIKKAIKILNELNVYNGRYKNQSIELLKKLTN